jgi:hypothetical protein
MSRATLLAILLLTICFAVMACSLFIASLTIGKTMLLIPAFICLAIVIAGVHLLAYKI